MLELHCSCISPSSLAVRPVAGMLRPCAELQSRGREPCSHTTCGHQLKAKMWESNHYAFQNSPPQTTSGGEKQGAMFSFTKKLVILLYFYLRLENWDSRRSMRCVQGTGRGKREKKSFRRICVAFASPFAFFLGKIPLPHGCQRGGWWRGVGLGSALLVGVPVKTGLNSTSCSHKLYSPGRSPCSLSTPGNTRHNLYAPTRVPWLWWI